jgi:hypothetical protein
MKNPHAVALGKSGGTAGRGKAKARTAEQASAAANKRWSRVRDLERDNAAMREAIARAVDMHLGRCASSEPLSAANYRHHACEARNILRSALPNQ